MSLAALWVSILIFGMHKKYVHMYTHSILPQRKTLSWCLPPVSWRKDPLFIYTPALFPAKQTMVVAANTPQRQCLGNVILQSLCF